MGRLDIFKRDGTNPFFLITVTGTVLVTIALIFVMTSLPHGQESGEKMPADRNAAPPAVNATLPAGENDPGLSHEPPPDSFSGEAFVDDSTADDLVPDEAAEAVSLDEMRARIEKDWQDLLAVFESEGISVDLENKRVKVKGAVIRDRESPRYPIEYVVVSEGGNTHEALILIKAAPSNLNAALLALGLEPGKSVIYRKKDPPPPPEDVESGKVSAYEVIPPKGTVMKIGVQCEEWGEDEIRPLEDLILDLRTRKSLEQVGWVFVGSRFATVLLGKERVQRYMADMERNVVALYLTGYGNAVFDVNTIDGLDDSLYDVNPEKAPPMGAKVTLVFSL